MILKTYRNIALLFLLFIGLPVFATTVEECENGTVTCIANSGGGLFAGSVTIDNVIAQPTDEVRVTAKELDGSPLTLTPGPYLITALGQKRVRETEIDSAMIATQSQGTGYVLFLPAHGGQDLLMVVEKKIPGTNNWQKLNVITVAGTAGNQFGVYAGGFQTADIIATTPAVVNHPPIITVDSSVAINELQTTPALVATATDADGDTLSYGWRVVSGGGTISNTSLLNPTYTAPSVQGADGTAVLELDVFDGTTHVKETVTVTIKDVPNNNTPPVANAGTPQTVNENTRVDLTGMNSTDADGDTLVYSWRQVSPATPQVTLTDSGTETPYFTAPEVGLQGASFTFELEVDDRKANGTDTATVVISVSNVNKPPVARAGADIPEAVAGTLVGLDASTSSDPDGQEITYLWEQVSGVIVQLTDHITATPTFTAPSASATLEFKVTVSDGALTHSDNVLVNVISSTKVAPVADAGADYGISENFPAQLYGKNSSDSDGIIVTYHWIQLSGKDVELSNSTSPLADFTAPNLIENDDNIGLPIEPLVFQLTVTDNDGLQHTDTVSITILDNLSCFIATAAYGSPMASQIHVLRDFRDEYLMTNVPGRSFVNFYYENSPPIANYIAERDSLRAMTRAILTPVIYILKYPVLLLLILAVFAWKKRTYFTKKMYIFSR